jgi:hypothetical protein
MTRGDLDVAVAWAAREGWNPGLHDADCFHAADPTGFLIGERDNTPVATISVVAYDAAYGFLGFYIVAPDARGRGYGMQIWRAGMAYLGERNIGLDGVVAQQDNYRKSGFTLAYRNIRFGADTANAGAPPGGTDIVPLARVPFVVLAAYDRIMFPAARDAFLHCWMAQPGSTARAAVREGALVGYGAIRPCRTGHKIGPLFADDAHAAEGLLAALTAAVPGGPIYFDTPEPNRAAVALAERHGMKPVFETARMYTRHTPEIDLDRVYGVTTFELG